MVADLVAVSREQQLVWLPRRAFERVEVRAERGHAAARVGRAVEREVDERVRRDVREQVVACVRDPRLLVGEQRVGRAVPGPERDP
jgi:hypothetical protein